MAGNSSSRVNRRSIVPKQLFRNAALTTACLLMTTGAGSAQQHHYSQVSARPGGAAQSPTAAPGIGRTTAKPIYPTPQRRTVTATDQYINQSRTHPENSTIP